MALARTERYSTVAIGFHWTIALLVLFNLAVGLLHESVPALRALMPAHKAVGITVLVLTAARVAWRLAHSAPALPVTMPVWQKKLAHSTHWLLYALLVVMPLSGWAMVSGGAKNSPLDWFGVFSIPYLPVSKNTGGVAHQAHGIFGWAMLALVALHIGAALYHHFIRRDRVLAGMAPLLEPR